MSNTEPQTVVIPMGLAKKLLAFLNENIRTRGDTQNLNALRQCVQDARDKASAPALSTPAAASPVQESPIGDSGAPQS